MLAVYGSTGFWSWLRYWWLDTENYTTWMLMDKGYYDYDYERPSEKTKAVMTAAKSEAELAEQLSRMGFGKAPSKPLTPAELQAEVMREEEKKRAALG